MLTPQEVSGRAFSKAAFGGYNMAMVDEFLDELTDDYTSLYKENAALKAKLKVLVDKVEEYRATEDSMRAALLTAQRMANTMVEEAEEKKKTMLAGAEDEARAKIGALQSDVELEQRRLNAAKAATAEFLQKTRELAQAQLALIERAPDLTPEEIAGGEKTEQKTEADVNDMYDQLIDGQKQMLGENYSRLVLNLDLPEEGQETFDFLKPIHQEAERYYPADQVLVVGNATSNYDLSTSFARDNVMISVLSVAFVILILLFTFQSVGLPILLILVIQGSISAALERFRTDKPSAF